MDHSKTPQGTAQPDRHSSVHPAFRGILNAIAPAQPLGPGPLEPTAEQRYVAQVAQTATAPAQAAYRRLVEELAANVPDVGYYDGKQLRPLSNAERACVLEANPDALNNVGLEPDELVAVLRGQLDAREWVDSLTAGPLRQWLFEDVCAEVERDEDIVRQDALDPYQSRTEAA